MRRTALGAAVVALAATSACGGDSPDPRIADAASTYVHSVAAGEMSRACVVLAPEAQRDLLGFVREGAPRRVSACPQALDLLARTGSVDFALAGVMDLRRAQHGGGKADVQAVDEKGARATARVGDSSKLVRLHKAGDRWEIARLDFSDVPR